MKTNFNFKFVTTATLLLLGGGCGGDDAGPHDEQAVLDNYATMVYQGYSDSLSKAQALKTAIDAFVAAPSADLLTAARTAWLAAREPYGQTEVYRFYNGPIDGDDGPEGLINSWPLDEAYVDYVAGAPTAGLINDTIEHPTLSKALIMERNEQGGETNISTGYHAIEFLLWGQDISATGPGARPYTDYVVGAGGTAANQERRGQYLEILAELLVENLTTVRDAWTPGAQNYGTEFRTLSMVAMARMLKGMGSLSGGELFGERLATAYDEKDQEDEHSCFSDNTHRDLYNNALGIQNVYLGRYGSIDGPGLDALVRAVDPALDSKMQTQLAATVSAIQAIPVPFDQAILGEDSAPGRQKVLAAMNALEAQTDTIDEIVAKLGIQLPPD